MCSMCFVTITWRRSTNCPVGGICGQTQIARPTVEAARLASCMGQDGRLRTGRGLKCGMSDYLTKPIDKNKLTTVLNDHFGSKTKDVI